jgi:hypothetical protein
VSPLHLNPPISQSRLTSAATVQGFEAQTSVGRNLSPSGCGKFGVPALAEFRRSEAASGVAQVGNLLYRRLVDDGADASNRSVKFSGRARARPAQRIANPRYSRLPVCATGKLAPSVKRGLHFGIRDKVIAGHLLATGRLSDRSLKPCDKKANHPIRSQRRSCFRRDRPDRPHELRSPWRRNCPILIIRIQRISSRRPACMILRTARQPRYLRHLQRPNLRLLIKPWLLQQRPLV